MLQSDTLAEPPVAVGLASYKMQIIIDLYLAGGRHGRAGKERP